jgi:hypothetical protein
MWIQSVGFLSIGKFAQPSNQLGSTTRTAKRGGILGAWGGAQAKFGQYFSYVQNHRLYVRNCANADVEAGKPKWKTLPG